MILLDIFHTHNMKNTYSDLSFLEKRTQNNINTVNNSLI
ncbi:hypothetical protein FM107_06825 [Sphingobacterium sp. JB170]|nr:hypothetical protein FM107_06825 [Sphingobacterium sp. JB170]